MYKLTKMDTQFNTVHRIDSCQAKINRCERWQKNEIWKAIVHFTQVYVTNMCNFVTVRAKQKFITDHLKWCDLFNKWKM